MTFADIYDLFVDRAENTLRLSPNTLALYSQTVKNFAAWADAKGISPEAISSRDTLTYISGLRRKDGEPYAVNSLRAHARDLKTMLRFAYDYEYIPRKIKVETPPQPKVKIEYLNDDEQASLLKHVDALDESQCRIAAIVHVLLETGLRLAEFTSLDWGQITWDAERQTGTIKDVLGKGRKYRDVYFGPRSWKYLSLTKNQFNGDGEVAGMGPREAWRANFYHPTQPVFWRLNPRPGRLGNRGVAMILNKIGKEIGLHLHPHKFRHTAIRNMVRRKMPLQAVMQISGHSSLKMIEHYSRLDNEDVQDLYASTMNGH